MPGSSFQKSHKTRLVEVPVLGEGIMETQFLHHAKAQTIREGPSLVRVLEKETLRIVKAIGIGPLNAARVRRLQTVEKGVQEVGMAARLQERRGLVEHV